MDIEREVVTGGCPSRIWNIQRQGRKATKSTGKKKSNWTAVSTRDGDLLAFKEVLEMEREENRYL